MPLHEEIKHKRLSLLETNNFNQDLSAVLLEELAKRFPEDLLRAGKSQKKRKKKTKKKLPGKDLQKAFKLECLEHKEITRLEHKRGWEQEKQLEVRLQVYLNQK